MIMLKIRNLESGYDGLRVLKGLSMHVSPGEIVAIIGSNGAGKSTLLNTIAGLIRLSAGSIQFKEKEIKDLTPDRIVSMGLSLVSEGRKLFAPMTVRENLMLGAYVLYREDNKKKMRENLSRIYQLFPVLREREHQLSGTLSGGEQQMLAIGRALMSSPDLIMMDEPSLGLAPLIIKDIFAVITKLREEGKTVLVVEQNAKSILEIADRGYVMETGSLVLEGTRQELSRNRDVQRAYLGREYKSIAD
jgi:branched-chain amino acid transport system ATP-binding protein